MLNNALVSHKYEFVLFWNGKCACTTMKKFFIKSIDDQYGYELKEKDLHTYIMKYYLNKETDEKKKDILSRYVKAIVVRNPFTRLVSFYTNKFIVNNEPVIVDKRKPGLNPKKYTFGELVNIILETPPLCLEHHVSHQSLQLDGIDFDYIMKMESLSDDIVGFLDKIKLKTDFDFTVKVGGHDTHYNNTAIQCDDVKSSEFNKTSIPKPEFFYNDNMMKKVYNYYKNDFDRFGYSYDIY